MRNDFFFISLVILYAFNLNSCSGSKDTIEPCQFVNPVASGHDPWVIKTVLRTLENPFLPECPSRDRRVSACIDNPVLANSLLVEY